MNLNLLKPKNFSAIFIVAHLISFGALFFVYSPGAIVSIILIILILIHFKLFVSEIFKKQNNIFLLFIFFELFSIINILFIDESREFNILNPTLLFETLSYIFIPQIAFYFFGSYIGKYKNLKENSFYLILMTNFIFGIICLYLHFYRPTFFNSFIDRTILNAGGGYGGFYPRLTGYLNSMIVGVIFSSSVILSIKYINNRYLRLVCIIIYLSCVFFSLQRGAWGSLILGIIFLLIIKLSIRPLKYSIKISKVLLIMILLYFISSSFSEKIKFNPDFFLSKAVVTDISNKFFTFSEALSERSYQYENFKTVIYKYPFGVGFGMLSHKSADKGFHYSIPDGNYYRIGGEYGVFTLLIFLFMILIMIYKLLSKKEYVLLITIIIFLMQGFGTNVFDLYMCGFLFWFLLGVSFNKHEIIE